MTTTKLKVITKANRFHEYLKSEYEEKSSELKAAKEAFVKNFNCELTRVNTYDVDRIRELECQTDLLLEIIEKYEDMYHIPNDLAFYNN